MLRICAPLSSVRWRFRRYRSFNEWHWSNRWTYCKSAAGILNSLNTLKFHAMPGPSTPASSRHQPNVSRDLGISTVTRIIKTNPQDFDPMLVWCWTTVFDGCPASNQHWLKVSCLLGWLHDPDSKYCVSSGQDFFRHAENINSEHPRPRVNIALPVYVAFCTIMTIEENPNPGIPTLLFIDSNSSRVLYSAQ